MHYQQPVVNEVAYIKLLKRFERKEMKGIETVDIDLVGLDLANLDSTTAICIIIERSKQWYNRNFLFKSAAKHVMISRIHIQHCSDCMSMQSAENQ